MKAVSLLVIICLLAGCAHAPLYIAQSGRHCGAHATGPGPNKEGGLIRNGFKLSISKTLRFGGGLLTGFMIHEAGHWTLLEAKDKDYKFYMDGFDLEYRYQGKSDSLIQMGGLMAGALSSEAILLIPREKREAYLNGVLMFNVLEGFCYPVFRHTSGDFKPLSHGERWTWGSIFVAHSLLTSYRIYRAGDLNFRTWIGATEKGTPMAGFRITW